MNYAKIIADGYIWGIVQSENDLPNKITKKEAENLQNIFLNKPDAPDGFRYMLNTDLQWVLVENPVIDEDATEEDYQNALEQMGVNFIEED